MRRAVVLGIGVLMLGAVGCASSGRVLRSAAEHEQRAADLEARGDYYGADRQRAAAQKQREKAARRAQLEQAPIPPPLLH